MEIKVYEKVGPLKNCAGFIDGTVIEVARPDDAGMRKIYYNGHKRKHALRYQAVKTAYGMFYHVYGLVERSLHDWTLYYMYGMDGMLE